MTTWLLAHFDGDLADASGNQTMTASSGAVISNAQSRFGGSALYLPTASASVRTGNSLVFDADFTLEAWVWLSSSTAQAIFGSATISAAALRIASPGVLATQFGGTYHEGATLVTTNTWHHVAICRVGTTVRTFLDGEVQAQFGYSGTYTYAQPSVGAVFGNGVAGGYVDELRVVLGTGLYTRPFTPPTAPLAVDHPMFSVYADSASAPAPATSTILPNSTLRTADLHEVRPVQKLTLPTLHDANPEYGNYRIVGTVKAKGTPNQPLARRVALVSEKTGRTLAFTWSDATTGDYAFNNISNTHRCTVIAFDHEGVFDAVIADNLQPTLMP